MPGHSIGEQICQCGAQMYHVLKYQQQNEAIFDKNAKKYATMNRPNIVNRVMRNNTNISDIKKLMDEIEQEMQDFIGSDDDATEDKKEGTE